MPLRWAGVVIDPLSLTADTDHFPATMGPMTTSVGSLAGLGLREQRAIVIETGFAKKLCASAI
jgi:hypothetical protein